MVNVLEDILIKLDGSSYDNQGFAVTSAFAEKYEDSLIKLQVKPYLKNEKIEGLPEEEHLKEMLIRLGCNYSDGLRYAVYKAEKITDLWELLVKAIQ